MTSEQQLEQLRGWIESGEFHHATYRCLGTLWEGLWIYLKDQDGFRGFTVAACFYASNPHLLKQAEQLCRGTGISVGSYGQG